MKGGRATSLLQRRSLHDPALNCHHEVNYNRRAVNRSTCRPARGSTSSWGRCCGILYHHRALLVTLFATFIFACQSMFVKSLQGHVDPIELGVIRFVFQLTISAISLIVVGVNPLPESLLELNFHILRSISGAIGLCCMYFALHHMRVGEATAILFAAPAFVGLLARIFLKEPFGLVDLILILTTIGGVFLVSQPQFLFKTESEISNELMGIIAIIISMLFTALAAIHLRQLGRMKINYNRTICWYAFIGVLMTVTIVTIGGNWSIPSCGYVRLNCVAIGLSSTLGQIFITYAYAHESAVYVSVVRTNEVMFSYMLEFLFFDVHPTLIGTFGAVIILVSSVGEVSFQNYNKKKEQLKEIKSQESEEINEQ